MPPLRSSTIGEWYVSHTIGSLIICVFKHVSPSSQEFGGRFPSLIKLSVCFPISWPQHHLALAPCRESLVHLNPFEFSEGFDVNRWKFKRLAREPKLCHSCKIHYLHHQHLKTHPIPSHPYGVLKEARCRNCTTDTPDGFLLPGVPRGVRAEYSAMAQHFRQIHAPEESNGTNGGGLLDCWCWVDENKKTDVMSQNRKYMKTPVAKF